MRRVARVFGGKIADTDQLTLEWSGAYARYHAAMMRTVLVGKASDHHRRMHDAAVEALEACEQAIRPGAPMGDVYTPSTRPGVALRTETA